MSFHPFEPRDQPKIINGKMNFYRLLSACSASLLQHKETLFQSFGVIIILIHFITSRVVHFDALIFGFIYIFVVLAYVRYFVFHQMNHNSQSRILKSLFLFRMRSPCRSIIILDLESGSY
jgi:hypothetical protein